MSWISCWGYLRKWCGPGNPCRFPGWARRPAATATAPVTATDTATATAPAPAPATATATATALQAEAPGYGGYRGI